MTTSRSSQTGPGKHEKEPRMWHLVTNHQNMLYMLAAGLVMGPRGFRGKHYSDLLSLYPGWIPLFREDFGIPADVFRRVTCEREYLMPCVASLDLSEYAGPVRILSSNGETREAETPATRFERKRRGDVSLLVRAPLPMTWVTRISFRSTEEKEAFQCAAGDIANVEVPSDKLETRESLFSSDSVVQLQNSELFEDEFDHYPARGQALGGALAMMYHVANRSDLALAAFRSVTGAAIEGDRDIVARAPVLAELPAWVEGLQSYEKDNVGSRLFWGAVDSLVHSHTKDVPANPADVAVTFLEAQLDELQEEKERIRLQELITDMRGLSGLGGGTFTELFDRHKGSVSRSLLLICARRHCVELLEFSHASLNDTDYLLAAVLFGASDGWLQLPNELRDGELSDYVTFRMADAEHRRHGGGFATNGPPRPKPLRELFCSPDDEGTRVQKDVAKDLANRLEWNECIVTEIALAEGAHQDRIKEVGSHLEVRGRVVATRVDMGSFLRCLGKWPPIDRAVASEVRRKLEGTGQTRHERERVAATCE